MKHMVRFKKDKRLLGEFVTKTASRKTSEFLSEGKKLMSLMVDTVDLTL